MAGNRGIYNAAVKKAREHARKQQWSAALKEYRLAVGVCSAKGIVQDAIRDLELIRAAGIEGLEPIFELLESAI